MDYNYIQIHNLVSTTLYTNLYTMSKEEGIIKLKGFNYKDITHRYILHIAKTLKDFYPEWKIEIEMNFINKMKFNISGNHVKFKRKNKLNCPKTCDDYIKDIENFYYPGLFQMIAIDCFSQGE